MIETAFAFMRLQGHRDAIWQMVWRLVFTQWCYEHNKDVA